MYNRRAPSAEIVPFCHPFIFHEDYFQKGVTLGTGVLGMDDVTRVSCACGPKIPCCSEFLRKVTVTSPRTAAVTFVSYDQRETRPRGATR